MTYSLVRKMHVRSCPLLSGISLIITDGCIVNLECILCGKVWRSSSTGGETSKFIVGLPFRDITCSTYNDYMKIIIEVYHNNLLHKYSQLHFAKQGVYEG